jgi:glycosyltransferase involved in cell wall biosynthesis
VTIVNGPRRLVTIGHSYVVAENRRLAHEMALAGRGRWHVTAIAPSTFRGDLRQIDLEPLDGEACEVIPLEVRRDRIPHLMSYRGLRAAFSAGADVVHCWEEPYVFAGAQIARRVPPTSLLVMATFQNLRKAYPWPLSAFEHESMRRADGWIAFGHTVAETLEPLPDYAEKPHRVIPPGVDVQRFRPDPQAGAAMRRRLGWTEDALVVGYLGRFAPQKGVTDLCAALDRMESPWHALFVGGGPLLGELEQFAARYPGRVHIATDVQHSEVPHWLNAMSLLCAPSRTTSAWREQFGRMLIEGMACGIPVLASDSGEMPVVIRDAGHVLPESDPPTWARALDRHLADPDTRELMARRGVERANTFFAWPVVARRHLEFFDALLDARPPA